MSRPTARAANRVVTIWPKSTAQSNGYGSNASYDAPYTIKACFMQGGSRQFSDTQGVLFTPASSFWYELPDIGAPKLNDMIAIGDHLVELDPSNVVNAESIRLVQLQDCSLLNDKDDLMVLT